MMKNDLKISEARAIKGQITIRAYKAGTKELVSEQVVSNLIMQGSYTGKDQFIKRLTGDTTYTGVINYGAIGTGSTAAAVTDTQLGAETVRVVPSTTQDVGYNEAIIQFFFPDGTLANGTYYEFGTFIDGTASVNTGKIFNRALFAVAYVKIAGTDTTVEVDITIT